MEGKHYKDLLYLIFPLLVYFYECLMYLIQVKVTKYLGNFGILPWMHSRKYPRKIRNVVFTRIETIYERTTLLQLGAEGRDGRCAQEMTWLERIQCGPDIHSDPRYSDNLVRAILSFCTDIFPTKILS
jgi:hypothetical protein